jgi:hypothetical protein
LEFKKYRGSVLLFHLSIHPPHGVGWISKKIKTPLKQLAVSALHHNQQPTLQCVALMNKKENGFSVALTQMQLQQLHSTDLQRPT